MIFNSKSAIINLLSVIPFSFLKCEIINLNCNKRAIIAIARKILVAIYHMLSTGEVFNPSDLSKVETSDKDRIKYTKNNFMQSAKQLLSLGLTSEEIILLVNSQNSNLTPIT